MNDSCAFFAEWLGRTMVIGGALLLFAGALLVVVRQPVRRRMIGSVAIRASLAVPLLAAGPRWLQLSLPADEPEKRNVPVSAPVSVPVSMPVPMPVWAPAPPAAEKQNVPFFSEPPRRSITSAQAVLAGYALVSVGLLIRLMLGQLAVRRMVRRSRPAGRALTAMLEQQARDFHLRPQVRVSEDLPAPVCCGLMRPVILLPRQLAEKGDEETLHWVFAHELAHLRHGDGWTAFWFGLAAVWYWPLPWFWLLRRRVELCQEYVADAEAAAQSRPEEYAAFLVDLSGSARPVRRPVGVTGVLGSPSELYRRITMLLKSSGRVDRACPRPWSLLTTGGFLCLALLFSGLGLGRDLAAAPVDEPKDPPAADEPKKVDVKPGEERFIRPAGRDLPRLGADATPQQIQEYVERMMQEMQRRMQQRFGGFGGQLQPRLGEFAPFGGGGTRLGVVIEPPHPALAEQLDLPNETGLVVTDVQADSAASKAGLKVNDILLEFNGKPVSSDPQEFRSMVADIKADTPVDAIILRKGKREEIKGLKLPEARADADNLFGRFGPGIPMPAIPNIQVAPLPQFPPVPPAGLVPGVTSKSTSIQINNNQFTVTSRENAMTITITGRADDGEKKLNSITIRDGGDSINVDRIESVPEKYRDKVNELLKSVNVGGLEK